MEGEERMEHGAKRTYVAPTLLKRGHLSRVVAGPVTVVTGRNGEVKGGCFEARKRP
jgi:hypothetical protein